MTELVKPEPDWLTIETEYRKGTLPLRTLASDHGITEGAIRKRAKRDQWERDLQAKIHARAEVLVRKTEVRKQVRKERILTERTEIEVAATLQARKILDHHDELEQWRKIEMDLMGELVATSGSVDLMKQVGELMAAPDEAGVDKLNDVYHRVIALPGRVDVLKKLAEVREKRINLERKVFNIKDDDQDNRPSTVFEVKLVALAAAVAQ